MLRALATLLALASLAASKIITFDWSIDWVTAAPDKFSRRTIGINGQFPLPTMEGTVGDVMVVNVYNNLGDQTTGLHFHGMDQIGTQFSDGPSGVTQCPIPPGASLKYTFNLDKPGTYWYHSHNKGQYPDGLRGPLIIHDPNDPYKGKYDEEILLTTSDWYHNQVPTLINQMLTTSNQHFLPPFPDSLLLNDTQVANFHFKQGKTYKIRLVSMAAFASVFFQFDSHTMSIIEVDGTYVVAKDAYQIRVAPAQRYTFLLKAQNSTRKNYGFLASLDENRDFTTDSPAIYPFNVSGNIIYDSAKALAPTYVVPKWKPADDSNLVAYDGQALLGLRDKVDKEYTLNFNFGFDQNGIPRSLFNGIAYVGQKVPTLFTAASTGTSNTNPVIYGAVNLLIVSSGQIVQIVINNMDAAIHPFHLHGHQFQVLERPASGKGVYTGKGRNFPTIPMRRDTVAVNANSYVVIRFQANNPGVWLLHCHIEWHVIMGLTATVIEAPELLRGLTLPADHKANCDAQGMPTAGNAAGNTGNFTDMTGANTVPEFPDPGAAYPKRMVKAAKSFARSCKTIQPKQQPVMPML